MTPRPAELSRTTRVVNRDGLHARPCALIARLAGRSRCTLRIRAGSMDADAKSVLELMLLEASSGTEIVLFATGDGAEALLDEVLALFAGGFGEPLDDRHRA